MSWSRSPCIGVRHGWILTPCSFPGEHGPHKAPKSSAEHPVCLGWAVDLHAGHTSHRATLLAPCRMQMAAPAASSAPVYTSKEDAAALAADVQPFPWGLAIHLALFAILFVIGVYLIAIGPQMQPAKTEL
jgi:hypothetical protein